MYKPLLVEYHGREKGDSPAPQRDVSRDTGTPQNAQHEDLSYMHHGTNVGDDVLVKSHLHSVKAVCIVACHRSCCSFAHVKKVLAHVT